MNMNSLFTVFLIRLNQLAKPALLVLTLALIIWWVWPDTSNAPITSSSLRVNVTTAGPVTVTPTLRLGGTLVAREDIAIGTALQDQRVSEVHVDVGQHVLRGQLLARLEINNVQARLHQTEAALSRAHAVLREQQAQEKEARTTLKRTESLVRSGAVSAQQVDEQRARAASAAAVLQAAQADVKQAQAQEADSRSQYEKTDILAPTDGVISARYARVGALAGTEPLFHLIGDDEIELSAEATTAELAQLDVGMAVKVSMGDRVTNIDGMVRYLAPKIDQRTRQGQVRIALTSANTLRVGAYAEASFILPEQVLPVAVPDRAVSTMANGESSVMLVDANGLITQRVVTIGRRHKGQLEIVTGLETGERIVREAIAFVRDGDQVIVANIDKDGPTR